MTIQINPYTKITLLDPDFVRTINDVLESSPGTSDGNGSYRTIAAICG